MKTMITIFVTLILSLPSFADTRGDSCKGYFSSLAEEFGPLYENKCQVKSEKDYCKCLNDELKTNVLKKALSEGLSLAEYKEKNKEANRQKLLNIYTNLNYEVSFQENKFGMRKEGQGQVGCTAENMAGEFRESLCNEYGDCKNKNGTVSKNTNGINIDNSSGTNLDADIDKINDMYKDKFPPYVAKNAPIIDKSNSESNETDPTLHTKDQPVDLAPQKDSQWATGAMFSGSMAVTAAQTFCKYDPKAATSAITVKLNQAKEFFKNNPKLLKTIPWEDLEILKGDSDCSDMELIHRIAAEFDAKVVYSAKAHKKVGDVKPVDQLMVENHFKNSDDQIKAKMTEGLLNSPANACIDYHQFKVYKSAPKADLLSLWGDMTTAKAFEDSLDPKNINSSTPTLNFLKNNPTIAKNIINPRQRKTLSEMLFKLSNTIKNEKDENKRLVSYTAFMKHDIGKLNEGDTIMDQLQCDLLAQNFAALESTDDLPALGLDEKDDQISNLANQFMACKMREDKKGKKTASFRDLIAANDLFEIFNATPTNINPKDDKEYTDFLADNCKGFEDFVKKDLKMSCLFTTNMKRCTAKAHDASRGRHKRLLERYYKHHKNDKIKMLSDVINNNTEELDLEKIFKKGSAKEQDAVARDAYVNIKPQVFSNRSIYSTDNIFRPSANSGSVASGNMSSGSSSSDSESSSLFGAIDKAQENYASNSSVTSGGNQAIANTNSNPSGGTTNGSEQNSPVNNSNTPGTSVNPGQVTPSFLNSSAPVNQAAAPKESTKISSVDDVEDAIEDLENIPADEKAEVIQNSKDYLAKQDQKNEQIISLQKKIANIDKEIDLQNHAPVKFANRSPANYNINNNTLGNGVNNGQTTVKSGITQSGNVAKISTASINKSAVSYEKALNQMNDKTGGGEKILVDGKSVFQFSGPISKSEIKGDLLVGVSLKTDASDFALLIGDSVDENGELVKNNGEALKAYLGKNLTAVPVDQVISIKCQDTAKVKCNPRDNELLLHISKDSKNNLVIRSVANNTKVARASSKDLINVMELETQRKIKQ